MNATPKAYQDVADELRTRITTGELAMGERLPNELILASQFGVSRATVREALRLLSAQDLIRTAKGATGGTYVAAPRFAHITSFLNASIRVLSIAEHISLDELLEARAMLEIPAARLAAKRRRFQDIDRMRANLATEDGKTYIENRDFHSVLLESCGNPLVILAAEPIFAVLMNNVRRTQFTARFDRTLKAQHAALTDSIENGDGDLAARLMEEHLDFLRPHYERAWLKVARRSNR